MLFDGLNMQINNNFKDVKLILSLLSIRSKIGPSMDHCGTPRIMFLKKIYICVFQCTVFD